MSPYGTFANWGPDPLSSYDKKIIVSKRFQNWPRETHDLNVIARAQIFLDWRIVPLRELQPRFERTRFSGGVNLSAIERNQAKIAACGVYVFKHERTLVCAPCLVWKIAAILAPRANPLARLLHYDSAWHNTRRDPKP